MALTTGAVGMEVVAGVIWPSPDRPAWTDLLVGNVPAPIITAGVGVLISWLPGHFVDAERRAAQQPTAAPSTQSKHPWRATLRTAVAGAVALVPVASEVAAGLHPDSGTAVGAIVVQLLAYLGLATRLMAMPAVETWLRTYVPALAPSPPRP